MDAYNAELRAEDGSFLGDKASNRAFKAIFAYWRDTLRKVDEDPLGDTPAEAISRRQIDSGRRPGSGGAGARRGGGVRAVLRGTWPPRDVAARLPRQPAGRGTERIVVGGGMLGSRAGELAVGRASVLLKAGGHGVQLAPIRHDPDHAGPVGGAHLAPPGLLSGHDGLLAVDIGGSNMRTGVVRHGLEEAPDLSAASVWGSAVWRHEKDKPGREEAVERLVSKLRYPADKAEARGFRLAPFVGIGCPGRISGDGTIESGGQNLPGDWEGGGFSLAGRVRGGLPRIGGRDTTVVVHNDAVVRGLSQAPWMRDVRHWAVLTVGTGLGNARFINRIEG